MKIFNILAIALLGSFVTIMGLSIGLEALLGKDTAMYIVLPTGLLIGMSARRIAEKILGYTTLEAMKEGSDDTGN
jgi:ACR3 family arsenite efflux pump ArsB